MKDVLGYPKSLEYFFYEQYVFCQNASSWKAET